MTEITDRPAYLDTSAALEARAHDLVSRLTLEEKVGPDGRRRRRSRWRAWSGWACRAVRVTDGPTGVRSNEGEPATVFPVGVAMAATWNPDLAREVAAAIGREALALDNHVVLAPTINIVRTPLWGRNFETYSEDPFLAGQLGAAFVEGLQGEGVGASLKHYAVNNQEENRMTVSVEVDERTLREIYLAAFEHVVKTANPWTVMASYNKVDGVYATENRRLMVDILKDEWGYDGVVVSDWGAVHATAAAANGGTDLEMPGPARWFGDKLLAAVRAGEVAESQIDDAALRMCRLILRTGALDGGRGRAGRAAHRSATARSPSRRPRRRWCCSRTRATCCRWTPAQLKRLAVVGPNAAARRIQGGGSSQVRTGPAGLAPLGDHRSAGRPRARCCTPTAATTSRSRPPPARRCSAPTRRAARPGCSASTSPMRDFDARAVRWRGRSGSSASWSATTWASASRRAMRRLPLVAAGSGPSATGATSSRSAGRARCGCGWTASR